MESSQPEKPSTEKNLQERCRQLEQDMESLRKKTQRLTRIEEEHAQQTAFLQQLINLIPIGIAVHTNGIVTFINPVGAAILKAGKVEDILGVSAIEFVHPDSRKDALNRIQSLLASPPTASIPIAPYNEEKFLPLDGKAIDVEVAAFPLSISDDGASILVLFRDITERKRQQQILQEREARFRQLISLLPDATIIHRNGIIFFANHAAIQLLKIDSEKDIIGHLVFEFHPPDEVEKIQNRIQEILRTRSPAPPENTYLRRGDGEIFLAEATAFPFEEKEGTAVLVVFRDITEREKKLNTLVKSESRFRKLAELLPASVFVISEENRILYLNTASQNILGYTQEESRHIDFLSKLHPHSLLESQRHVKNLNIDEKAHFELQIKNKWDKWQWLDVTIIKTIMEEDVVLLGAAIDITWQKETESVLKRQAQKLITAYEEERGRIARELHDEIGQQLIGMKFVLEAVQRSTDSEAGQAALLDARQILAYLTENVRELSLSSRPSLLDDLGLLPTLLWHFERYTNRTGIQVQFSHTGFDEHPLSQAAEITIYRIVQESLTNVARHAQVDAVSISIQAFADHVHLVISDEGVGFSLEKALDAHASSGLTGMKERVELLGGEMIIDSAPNKGTTITAIIPLFEN
jgi:PAS domain S-box-containing protein